MVFYAPDGEKATLNRPIMNIAVVSILCLIVTWSFQIIGMGTVYILISVIKSVIESEVVVRAMIV